MYTIYTTEIYSTKTPKNGGASKYSIFESIPETAIFRASGRKKIHRHRSRIILMWYYNNIIYSRGYISASRVNDPAIRRRRAHPSSLLRAAADPMVVVLLERIIHSYKHTHTHMLTMCKRSVYYVQASVLCLYEYNNNNNNIPSRRV